MLTYKKTIVVNDSPRLEIDYSEAQNPREDDNLGYFITKDSSYYSPDRHEIFEKIVSDTGDQASNQEDHMQMIKERIENDTDEIVIAMFPICKYEHSGVSYSLGTKHGFDNSNNGFYIITESSQDNIGVEPEDFEKCIQAELDIYNKYINGECYGFVLYNKDGEVEDSCSGFYDVEDIKEDFVIDKIGQLKGKSEEDQEPDGNDLRDNIYIK